MPWSKIGMMPGVCMALLAMVITLAASANDSAPEIRP
jgi:hypothetical protein